MLIELKNEDVKDRHIRIYSESLLTEANSLVLLSHSLHLSFIEPLSLVVSTHPFYSPLSSVVFTMHGLMCMPRTRPQPCHHGY